MDLVVTPGRVGYWSHEDRRGFFRGPLPEQQIV